MIHFCTQKEFNAFCSRVNESAWVFENWDKITSNLTDSRMTKIDGRRLRVGQLYKSKNINWCLQLNDHLRSKTNQSDDATYSAEKFQDILNYIIDSKILEDIEHNPSQAASLASRLHITQNIIFRFFVLM